jgi:hypothetical protein
MERLYPHQIHTELDLDSHVLTVENSSCTGLDDIVVSLQDGYAQDVCIELASIRPWEKRNFPIANNLHFYHFENGVKLRIYSEGREIYSRVFNHWRKRAFVFYSNKGFEEITRCAIEGLRNFSETDIIYYTVGFESQTDIRNVRCKRHDPENPGDSFENSQYMQMIKPEIFLRALNDGFEDCLFIDSDVQVRSNIESVFDRHASIDPKTPVLNRNFWQFLFVGDRYIPEEKLRLHMGHDEDKQFQGHGITNIFLFRKEMRELFEKWNQWCHDKVILNDIRKDTYLHDEVIFNLLCWKEKVKQVHGNMLFNVKDLKDVKAFHHLRAEPGQGHLDFNKFGCGHFSQSFAPYETEDIVGFHCVKDPAVARSINAYLRRRIV